MNPSKKTFHRSRILRLLGTVMGGAIALISPLAGAESTEPKTFVLFMGADVDVELNNKPHRVKNVAGDAFVVTVDQRPVEVPMNRGAVKMKVIPQLKLSDKTALVSGLKFERAYTPENDPVKKWLPAQAAGAAQANVGLTAGKWANALQGQQQAAIRMQNLFGPNGSGAVGPPPELTEYARPYNQAQADVGANQNNSGYIAMRMQEELDRGLFDAVRVTCEISSPKPMHDPYVVIITQYREKDDPPGAVKNWVYAWQLDRLDENPVKIQILKGGFPPGFEMMKQQFHVYGAGRELGTNVADKNVPLTRDEAHQYIVIDHLVTHKKDTLPPAVALGVSQKDFYPHYGSEQVKQEIYVKVDKDGLPGGAFRNERCTEPSGDDYLEKLVSQTRFKPAIKAGKPIDGVARLKIIELAL